MLKQPYIIKSPFLFYVTACHFLLNGTKGRGVREKMTKCDIGEGGGWGSNVLIL